MSADKTEIDEMHKWLYELESRRYSLHDIAEKILDRQERRERELLKAVYRYGIHDFECPARKAWGLQKISPECSCGLDRLLARLDGKKEKSE